MEAQRVVPLSRFPLSSFCESFALDFGFNSVLLYVEVVQSVKFGFNMVLVRH
jgi:hypothetical protein